MKNSTLRGQVAARHDLHRPRHSRRAHRRRGGALVVLQMGQRGFIDMTVQELDLARAKDMAWSGADQRIRDVMQNAEKLWAQMGSDDHDWYLRIAAGSRLGDEARGLCVVPVEMEDPDEPMSWPEWLAASPFAPEEKG